MVFIFMRFFYYISQSQYPVTRQSLNWEVPLPVMHQSTAYRNLKIDSACITTGEYFTAASSFLSRNDFEPVLSAIQSLYQVNAHPGYLEAIRIYLVKHGKFYHPSRIEVEFPGKKFLFALTVAVSEEGNALIEKELQLLRRLGEAHPCGFLPRVLSYAEVPVQKKFCIRMFLGEWFEGFNEFHLSQKPDDKGLGILVWDDSGNYFLDDRQTLRMYAQASKILTRYYDPISSEQIFSWHHAAGDFILKPGKETVDLKLITVRNYMPLIQGPVKDAGTILDGLLMFFLILSLRMRLDRLDGTGEYAWAGDPAVNGTVSGFAEGLRDQAESDLIPMDLVKGIYRYVASFSFSGLLEWATSSMAHFHPDGPEIALIKFNLFEHVKKLHACFQRGKDNFFTQTDR